MKTMDQPTGNPDFHDILSLAAQHMPAVPTPECLKLDTLVALIEEPSDTPDSRRQMSHVVTCGYCSREYAEMEQRLKRAAREQELQEGPSKPERKGILTSLSDLWRGIFAPPAFAMGATVALLAVVIFGVMLLGQQTRLARLEILQRNNQVQLTQQRQTYEKRIEQEEKEKKRLSVLAERPVVVASTDDKLIRYYQTHDLKLDRVVDEQDTRGRAAPETPIALLSPVASTVRGMRPRFHWKSLSAASDYVVTLLDSRSQPVAQSRPQDGTSWQVTRALSPGESYYWQVAAKRGGKQVLSPSVQFTVLDTKRASELAKVEQTLAVSLGIRYAQAGLLDDATHVFEAVPKSDPNYAVAQKLLHQLRTERSPK